MSSPVARLKTLMSALDLDPCTPVTAAELKSFEEKTGVALIPELHEVYQFSDGVPLLEGALKVMPLAESEGYPEYFFQSGLFPLVDNSDSDPWCVQCSGALRGFVVQVCHDDVDRIKVKFRSLERFLTTLAEWIDEDNWDLHDMPCDFDRAERTPGDIAIGRQLVAEYAALDKERRVDVAGMAVVLLSEEQVEEIASLLTAGDPYVREHAQRRLRDMNSATAKAALEREDLAVADFVQECLNVLAKAGLPASLHGDHQIRVEPSVGLNMNVFLARRQDPKVFDYLVERCRALVEKKKR